jgi:hypothetical protein
MLAVFPKGDTYLNLSDSGVCDLMENPQPEGDA